MILNLVLLKDSGGYPQLGVLNLWKGRKSEIYFNLLDQKPVIFGIPSFLERYALWLYGQVIIQINMGLSLLPTENDLIYSVYFLYYICE